MTEGPFADVPSSETVHGLPPRHWHCHLGNFDWSVVTNGSAKAATVRRFLDAHLEGEQGNLLLIGAVGAGKTHIGVGIYRAVVATEDLTKATWLHVPSVAEQVKARFDDKTMPDPLERLDTARLVVLDDLYGREPTDWERSQIHTRLIDTAYRNGASLVLTDNHGTNGLQAQLAAHEWSRLQERATVLDFFEDDDYRKRRDG